MNILNTAIDWIKNNKTIAIIGGLAIFFLLFGKKLFAATVRRRHRTVSRPAYVRRKTAKRSYTSGGKAKKPWQVKGSDAARRHMARLRRMK